jgi:hypothetical protein
VDGVTKADSVQINRACSHWRDQDVENRCFVLVSSVSVVVALEQDKEAKIVHHTVASWTLEQYEQAITNPVFFESVKYRLQSLSIISDDKEALLLAKYECAGGCARWMFEFTYQEWKDDFDRHIERVENYALVFHQGGGDLTEIAVNHLRGVTVDIGTGNQAKHYFFVSKYAADVLGQKCDNRQQFLRVSYQKAYETKNPAYLGWIFEFDVTFQLQEAYIKRQKLSWKPRTSQPSEQMWNRVDLFKVFKTVPELADMLNGDQVLWVKPASWCQKAYDFLCFWRQETRLYMLAANATHKNHSVLLCVVQTLATNLKEGGYVVDTICIDFLVPVSMPFALGDVKGRLSGWKTRAGNQWENKPDSESYISNGSISIVNVPTPERDKFSGT